MKLGILFLDIEAGLDKKIHEYGLVFNDETLRTSSLEEVKIFIKLHAPKYISGHNFVNFDKLLLEQTSFSKELNKYPIIDTLPASLLLFNEKTFHALPKHYKNEDDFKNNPVEDSYLTRTLLEKVIEKFRTIPRRQQLIFYSLLQGKKEFEGFLEFLKEELALEILVPTILEKSVAVLYESVIINKTIIKDTIENSSVELAYILALLTPVTEIKAHPPKILFDYPRITQIQKALCFSLENSIETLADFSNDTFGFKSFNSFKRLEENSLFSKGDISQREIIEAELRGESFIAVLPTGGGKTFTFWLPSLIKAKAYKSLTVIISPLQALIKDHIESFNKKVPNYTAVAISGFLTPLERADAIDKVINGEADILYLAPESLRSNAIFSMLKNRLIERFVIDEAHCLSTWGNDFRHDYFYIGEFVKDLLEEKPYQDEIPISCFTATAKPNVLDDISKYIKDSLGLGLERYLAVPERYNLDYEAIEVKDKKEKYINLVKMISEREGATLIYIPSSTKTCDEIAQQLSLDTDKSVKSFHSKLDTDIKMQILDDYISNQIDIVVATTAFGMGVDKPNILNVIHYEASDSLESYSQEAGRGARDQKLRAMCPLLFDENDLDKHFNSLNRSKTSVDEINAVFRVLKASFQNPMLKTTLEIAKAAHWDVEDNAAQYDVKVKTSLLELEREGYIERKRNRVRFFGDSVVKDSLTKLRTILNENKYNEETSTRLILVLQTLLGRGKPQAVQIDELALLLGYEKREVAEGLVILKELKIINESKDLSLLIARESISKYKLLLEIERTLFTYLKNSSSMTLGVRELNEMLIEKQVIKSDANMSHQIKETLKFWRSKEIFQFNRVDRHKDIWYVAISDVVALQEENRVKHQLSSKIIEYFTEPLDKKTTVKKFDVEFSMSELKSEIEFSGESKTIEKTLLYLHEMKLLELSQGRFIYYAPMSIHKTEKVGHKTKYTKPEYQIRMAEHYQSKIESIHIMGEYAKYLLKDKKHAAKFMKDYFIMSYSDFKKEYKLSKKISQPLTQAKSDKIYNNLSQEQQSIMQDTTSKGMMILAGPGSGKTKVLVHKIAALILNEDVKPEQFLMLTYSRTAMIEFKSRLYELIGSLAAEVDIATFHGYALQLVARRIDSENQDLLKDVISQATTQINDNVIAVPFKTVLVLDEYQDINEDGFQFIKAIYESLGRDLRIIAVGDDDQCIMQHTNGASVEYIDKFQTLFGEEDKFSTYELLNNFRSDVHLIEYTQEYISCVQKRYKENLLIPNTKRAGHIEFVHTKSANLIEPTINICKAEEFEGSTILLAHTNEEVLGLYSHLKALGFEVEYLLDNENFDLRDLIEIYTFNEELLKEEGISEEILYKVLGVIKARFSTSKNCKMVKKLVKLFVSNTEIYTRSLWEEFLDELNISMFEESAKFNISTIHKSKGKEFDNVIMQMSKPQRNDYFRRLYYVGMTRAKHTLYMISNDMQFDMSKSVPMRITQDINSYETPKLLTVLMGLEDIYLNFSGSHEFNRYDLIAGTALECAKIYSEEARFLILDGEMIARFSKAFDQRLAQYEAKGYRIESIEIESVVHWQSMDKSKDLHRMHPLCKIVLFQ